MLETVAEVVKVSILEELVCDSFYKIFNHFEDSEVAEIALDNLKDILDEAFDKVSKEKGWK